MKGVKNECMHGTEDMNDKVMNERYNQQSNE